MNRATERDKQQRPNNSSSASNRFPSQAPKPLLQPVVNSYPLNPEGTDADRLREEAQRTLNTVSYQLANLSQKWSITDESPSTAKELVRENSNRSRKAEPVDSRKHSISSSSGQSKPPPNLSREHQAVPYMYKAALTYEWEDVVSRTFTYPMEATYVHGDGSTVLLLAIISRVVYSNCTTIDGQLIRDVWNFSCDKAPAPLDVIGALVNANPEAVKIRCKRLGYTPLTYALLVPRTSDFEAESLVRLLIESKSDNVFVSTASGRSPLEIHIQSYSQTHGTLHFMTTNENDAIKSTRMLQILLEPGLNTTQKGECKADSLGCISTSKLLEVLYECNSSAILDALECASISSGRNNSLSMKDLNGWWVWQWMLVLLKYSVADTWTHGSEFSATHAAVSLDNGCPMPLLMLLVRAFPNQARIPCPMTGTNRYALHSVCCWGGKESSNDDPMNYSRKQMAISAMLREYPAATSITDSEERTPLCLALENRTLWNGGVSKLYRAFPGALHVPNPQTGLYPFMTAASAAPQRSGETRSDSSNVKSKNTASIGNTKELQQLWTIFGLLRAAPEVIVDCIDNNEDTNSFLEFRRAAEQQSLSQILQDWPAPFQPE